MKKGDVIVDITEHLTFYRILKTDPDEGGFVKAVGITVTKEGELYGCDSSCHLDINERQADETRYALTLPIQVPA